MAGRAAGFWRDGLTLSSGKPERARRGCCCRCSGDMRSSKLSSLAIILLLLTSTQAFEEDDASGSSPSSMHLLGTFLMTGRNPATVVQSGLKGLSKDAREEPAFSSIFTLIASTAQKPPEAPGDAAGHEIETRPRPSNKSSNSFPSSVPVSNQSNTDSTKRTGTVASARSTSADPNHQTKNSGRRSPEPRAPSNRSSASVVHQERTFVAATAAQSQSTTSNTATTASTPFITTKTTSAAKRRSKTVVRTTTTGLPDSPKTTPRARSSSTAQTAKPGSSRSTIGPPLAAATEAMTIRCNITDRMWIKTVLSVQLRRSRLDSILKQNLPRGFTQALKKALNDSRVQATLESISSVPNVTVGYYVTSGEMVYTPSVVVEALGVYGIERLMADVRQFVPLVQAVRIPAVPWRTSPNVSLMLKTVLRFVGPADDVRSCRFNQMMERRLENAFEEAEAIVMNSHSSLSVQIMSVSQALGSPAVSLMYVVYNGSVALNGTAASTLLSHLTAELVGYFLFYPPLITAEPLEYHNLNTSIETRLFWIVTVIQDVSNSSLEAQYQSFASLMEERLAEIFMVVHQQGVRFKRATTVGSYTVQMVRIRRVHGPKNPAEMTYYVQQSGSPLLGASAAKLLNTVDSQTMALTLGYFVQLQAEAVVKNPPNNLWIIAAVLAPIAVVTLIIIIITIILCHKNKSEYKADSVGSYNPRVKTGYWRDVGYYPQPVQGFDYAKQHLGRQGSDDQALQVTQDTNVPPHPIKDAPLSLEKPSRQDGSVSKKSLNSVMRKRLPSEDGSVISSESVKEVSGKGSSVRKATAQKKPSKEESRKSHAGHYDSSSGSLQLISIKPTAAPTTFPHAASSERNQESAVFNGEVNLALKQKSDIEHYRNKLRLKARKKGYYDFPSGQGKALSQRPPGGPREHSVAQEQEEDDRGSTYVKQHRRPSQPSHRSRQSLNSPSPGGTEMDLLVMRERPRKGIRNSGYDTEPEILEETDVDHLIGRHYFGCGRHIKGQSETSTLSSQPSIDEVRHQMHLLLEEAFSLASAGRCSSSRTHHQLQLPPLGPWGLGPLVPYTEVLPNAPGTAGRAQGGLQWVPAHRSADPYQCSLGRQAFRFTQLPEMSPASPPPPVPPRTGAPPESSLARSSSDLGPNTHCSESSIQAQRGGVPYLPDNRTAFETADPPSSHSGNPMTAVYAIPAARPGHSGYFISTPPSSYHSPSWMSYPPEPEDVSPQWAESMPLPGYAEAFPHPHYPQGSPLLWHRRQAPRDDPEQPQQSLADSGDLSSLSTSALVKAIRQEVAKLAQKQTDMFDFQV